MNLILRITFLLMLIIIGFRCALYLKKIHKNLDMNFFLVEVIIINKNCNNNLSHWNYDSAIKFELEGVGMNKIILFFSDKH